MYTMNPTGAKQADTAGGRIDTTGKYIGQFVLAEHVIAGTGTQGVEFSFRSEDGLSADYLTVWTVKSDGTDLPGRKMIDAIMACLKLRSIAPSTIRAEKYDRSAGERVSVDVQAFPDLMGKDIGLLLQKEPYEANDGAIKNKMVIALPFEASTGFTASEILSRATKPEIMERRLATLKDRPMQARRGTNSAPVQSGPASDDQFDDIPF